MIEEILNVSINERPQLFSYTFKLINNYTIVNLPYSLDGCKRLKIKFIKFTTGSANNEVMMIRLNHFNLNIYYNGSDIIRCAKTLPMPSTINTTFVYDNQSFTGYDMVVNSRPEGFSINQIIIEVLIDGEYKDISPSNPFFIELELT